MLEVVDVSASIYSHIIIFVQDRHHILLHVGAFVFGLGSVGIDRMVSYHNYPILISQFQCVVESIELSLWVLLASIRIFSVVLTITVDKWSSVEEDDTNGCALALKHLSIVSSRHHPAAAHLTIV